MQDSTRRKVGRPKLPKGEAKGRIVPVRFTSDTLKAIAIKANEKDQTISDWIRGTVDAALQNHEAATAQRPKSRTEK
jgi:hypothetical protein